MSITVGNRTILAAHCLKFLTTLRAGGKAEWFISCNSMEEFAEVVMDAHQQGIKSLILGGGSNVLISDDGVPGLVIHNKCQLISASNDGEVIADSGCSLQELFLKTAQRGLQGLEFVVGIPGTLGGALVSNAGAYRSSISEFLTGIEIVVEGERKWVPPDWMEFSYRDSILRKSNPPQVAILRARMKLPKGNPHRTYSEARDYQQQRISKQPPQASAGSFFKNVYDKQLAQTIEGLPQNLRDAGVVPSGFLIMDIGLSGYSNNGAMFSRKHANFIINARNATATNIRRLAEIAKAKVWGKHKIVLEEEVLYIGDWSRYQSAF